MVKNLILTEAEFDEFKQYCYEKGFDLSYFGPDVSGSKEEIERYQFDNPKVIKLKRRRCFFSGTPYDVAEWQQLKWLTRLTDLQRSFPKDETSLRRSRIDERVYMTYVACDGYKKQLWQ